jgi:hypothetical protein
VRRRSLFVALIAFAGIASAGCGDARPPVTAPLSPEVSELLSATGEVSNIRTQSDALLTEPARTLARFALAKVQSDIQYKRSTVYISSLAFAAIPLFERKLNRIPEDKAGKLVELLCALQKLIGPHLPPTLMQIPWCKVAPEELGNEAKFQLVSNSTGAKLTTSTEQLSLTITANTMKDANNNLVQAAFFSILPLSRRPGIEGAALAVAEPPDVHPCPVPWDPDGDFAANDCYPEYYEIAVQPAVRFVGTPARLWICQLDPGSGADAPPTNTVLNRLRLFSQDGQSNVSLVAQSTSTEGALACAEDPDLHTTAIGPIDLSRRGLRNAWLSAGRLASRALKAVGPTTLYAGNVPTHGDLFDELLGIGNIFGAIDPIVQATHVSIDPNTANIFRDGHVDLTAIVRDKVGNPLEDAVVAWSASPGGEDAVATVTSTGPLTARVSGVRDGVATINGTSGRGISTAFVTVDPRLDFRGAWDGSWTDADFASNTGRLIVDVTGQTGGMIAGSYSLFNGGAAPYEILSLANALVDGATLTAAYTVRADPCIARSDITLTKSGNTLAGTHFNAYHTSTEGCSGLPTTKTFNLSLTKTTGAAITGFNKAALSSVAADASTGTTLLRP